MLGHAIPGSADSGLVADQAIAHGGESRSCAAIARATTEPPSRGWLGLPTLMRTLQYGVGLATPLSLVVRTYLLGPGRSERSELPMVAPARPDEIALTFDGGPHVDVTPRVVDTLTVRGISATFFLFGQATQEEPYLTRYIVDCGHLVGTHTWASEPGWFDSVQHLRQGIYRSRNTIEQITGKPVRYFRPPRGARYPGAVSAARSENMTSVLWNVKPSDWRSTSPDRVYRQLIHRIDGARSSCRAANIALPHGGLSSGRNGEYRPLEAIRRLVERYRAVRQFVTVDRWFAA